jgi:hypothetical protein
MIRFKVPLALYYPLQSLIIIVAVSRRVNLMVLGPIQIITWAVVGFAMVAWIGEVVRLNQGPFIGRPPLWLVYLIAALTLTIWLGDTSDPMVLTPIQGLGWAFVGLCIVLFIVELRRLDRKTPRRRLHSSQEEPSR